jgi:uncharacterized protein (TIGR02246 family)
MTSDEQAIRHLVSTWLSATAAGDTETVLSLMADEVVFLTPGQQPMRGKAAFAAGQAALQRFRIEATGEIRELRVCGDWAYCWNHLTVVVTPREGGSPIKRAGDVLSIFQRQPGGSWVLLRDANLLAAVS